MKKEREPQSQLIRENVQSIRGFVMRFIYLDYNPANTIITYIKQQNVAFFSYYLQC